MGLRTPVRTNAAEQTMTSVLGSPVPVHANAPAAGKWLTNAWVRDWLPLLVILVACLAFRLPLAEGSPRLLQPLAPEMLAQPWKLLLPFDFGGGRYRWTPTGHVVLGLFNLWLSVPTLFLLMLGVLVVVSYIGSLVALRSRVFSSTLALCMGIGSQFNYGYVHNGGIIWILFSIYFLVNACFLYALATRPGSCAGPRLGFVVSLAAFALCWEQWLDYLVFLLAGCAFFSCLCLRHPELRARYLGRVRFVALTSVVVAALYFGVKLPYAGEHFTPGHESDTIFTYSNMMMGIEDLLSNVVTYPYIALTNYAPSWFNSSNSLYWFGSERLVAEQHGYHPEKSSLVVMHHLFFWHFYAGAVFLAFCWASVRVLRSVWKTLDHDSIIILVFLLMVWTGYATHTISKFRPYMSVPLLAYKCMVSVLGVSLLLSYLLTIAARFFTDRRKYVALVIGVWSVILMGAVDRFRYHSHLSQQAGLGAFPDDPVHKVKALLRKGKKHR